MQLQKPTVLDAARLGEELKSLAGLEIDGAFSGFSDRQLYIKFRKFKSILRYSADKNSAYMGISGELPDNPENPWPVLTVIILPMSGKSTMTESWLWSWRKKTDWAKS